MKKTAQGTFPQAENQTKEDTLKLKMGRFSLTNLQEE